MSKFRTLRAEEIHVVALSRCTASQGEGGKSKPKFVEFGLFPKRECVAGLFDEAYGWENWHDGYETLNGKFLCKIAVRVGTKSPFFDRSGIGNTPEEAYLQAVASLGLGRELTGLPKMSCGARPSDFNGKCFKDCFKVAEIQSEADDKGYRVQHLLITDQYGRARYGMQYGKKVAVNNTQETVAIPEKQDVKETKTERTPSAALKTWLSDDALECCDEADIKELGDLLDSLSFEDRVMLDAILNCKSFNELKDFYVHNGNIDRDGNIFPFFEKKYETLKVKN